MSERSRSAVDSERISTTKSGAALIFRGREDTLPAQIHDQQIGLHDAGLVKVQIGWGVEHFGEPGFLQLFVELVLNSPRDALVIQ